MLNALRLEIKKSASPQRAKSHLWFFKTQPGQYGHGDQFIGLTVPQTHSISKKYFKDITLANTIALLQSPIHEERQIALQILVLKYQKFPDQRDKIIDLYLKNTSQVNNWDLVDGSAEILGQHLLGKPITLLTKLAQSKNIWERRIAIIATYAFIKNGNPQPTLAISKLLLADKEDLIHKAVGWMLREVGKRISQDVEEDFLRTHLKQLPRTTLRYAIERFPEPLRLKYLKN